MASKNNHTAKVLKVIIATIDERLQGLIEEPKTEITKVLIKENSNFRYHIQQLRLTELTTNANSKAEATT